MAPIAVGDTIPDGKLDFVNNMHAVETVSIYSIITAKKVLLFGISGGAFMPESRMLHAPGEFQKIHNFDAVEDTLFVSVNDPYVMWGWERSYFPNNTRVKFLADTTAAYVTSLGLQIDLTSGGFGVRSRRFSMILEDRKVVQLKVIPAAWSPPFSIFEKQRLTTISRVPIAVGDIIPDGTLTFFNQQSQMELVSMHSIVSGKKVLILGVHGAFFGRCRRFVRTFIMKANDFKSMGVQEILCISVNDPFVMWGWKWASFKDDEHINFLADPTASYVASLGLPAFLMKFGMRSRRFSMLLDDCRVKVVKVDGPGTDSLLQAEDMLATVLELELREVKI